MTTTSASPSQQRRHTCWLNDNVPRGPRLMTSRNIRRDPTSSCSNNIVPRGPRLTPPHNNNNIRRNQTSWSNENMPRGPRLTHNHTHHHHHHPQGRDHDGGLSHGNNTAPDFDQQRQNPPTTERAYSRRSNIHHHHHHQGYYHSMPSGIPFVYVSSMAVHGHHLYSLEQGLYVPSIPTHYDPYIYGYQISNHMQNNFTRHPSEEEILVLHDFYHMMWPVEETIIVDEVGELVDDEEIQSMAETISQHLKTRTYKREGNDEEGDDICVVCQDEFEDNDKLATLQCGHEYHVDCIKKWLLQNNVCPICRATALIEE